jgi:hypothetical protein
MKTNAFAVVGSLIVGIVVGLVFRTVLFPPPPPPPPPPAGLCGPANPNDLCIDVTVITVGGQPQIASIADGKMKAQGVIFWTVVTPGYSFPVGGIDFANPGGTPSTKPVAPAGEFHGCMPMPPSNTSFKCNDKHGNLGPFGYKVTLTNTPPTPPVPSLDPWIVNQ